MTDASIQTTEVSPGRTAASSALAPPGATAPGGAAALGSAAASKNVTPIPRRPARRRSQSAAPWYNDPRGDDVLAAAHRVEERRDPGEPRGEHERLLRAFEPGQHLLDLRTGRVAGAAVPVADQLVAFVAGERRGRVDRRHDGAGFGIDEMPALGEQGLD